MNMFKKFRNKILFLNMAITSAVVLSAFCVIYFITYNSTRSEIQSKLDDEMPGIQFDMQNEEEAENETVSGETIQGGVVVIESDDYQMFSVIVDAQGNILEEASGTSIEQGLYEQAVNIAWNDPDNKSDVTLDGRQWRYAVTPIINVSVSEDSETINNDGTTDKFSVVFLDVTSYNETLFDLMTTLLLVAGITLVAIFLVCLFFANRAIKPLAGTWQKQKQFVADASHELKTPLSIINANYDALLANQEETVQSQIKWLDYIKIGTDRMTKLINDLLTLAKFDEPNPAIRSTSFNFSKTVQSVLLSMDAAMLEKGIELSFSIEPGIFIESDPEGLNQIILILLDNALKYTDQNGQIDVVLSRSNQQAELFIKNSGKGIPEQELPKIFDRFYRGDHSRTHKNGSYGLGLSIAKAVTDLLGGDIQAQSTEGEYTTFAFRINLK